MIWFSTWYEWWNKFPVNWDCEATVLTITPPCHPVEWVIKPNTQGQRRGWISLWYFLYVCENRTNRNKISAWQIDLTGGLQVCAMLMIFQLQYKLIFPFAIASHNSLLSTAFHAWLLNRISRLVGSSPAAANEAENWELISYWAEKTPSLSSSPLSTARPSDIHGNFIWGLSYFIGVVFP